MPDLLLKESPKRAGNRPYNAVRSLKVIYGIFSYAAGSVLFEMGNTKILCAITLQAGVPHFLKGKQEGWLTAEYALLPASTPLRTVREVTVNKRSGRTIEISRLIGRALRSIIKFNVLGEYTIFVDCDVLQADGGTRTACVTAAYLALLQAQERWQKEGIIKQPILKEALAALSVGVHNSGHLLLDVDFAEDSDLAADFNFIVTQTGKIVEIQGTAEKDPLPYETFLKMQQLAFKGAEEIFTFFQKINESFVARVPLSSLTFSKKANLSGFSDSVTNDSTSIPFSS